MRNRKIISRFRTRGRLDRYSRRHPEDRSGPANVQQVNHYLARKGGYKEPVKSKVRALIERLTPDERQRIIAVLEAELEAA